MFGGSMPSFFFWTKYSFFPFQEIIFREVRHGDGPPVSLVGEGSLPPDGDFVVEVGLNHRHVSFPDEEEDIEDFEDAVDVDIDNAMTFEDAARAGIEHGISFACRKSFVGMVGILNWQ